MRCGITIGTWGGGRENLEVLLSSMRGVTYPILLFMNDATRATWFTPTWREKYLSEFNGSIYLNYKDSYELGAIKATLTQTNWDEFVFLQDTIEFKDTEVLTLLLENFPESTVAYNQHFQMYLGKYRRSILERMEIPEITTKVEAVREEGDFHKRYFEVESSLVVFNHNFIDQNFYGNYEERFGRRNLIMEDQYLIKRKGTWDAMSQL